MNSFVRDDKTLRKKTRRLIKNVSRRIERIEKYDKETTPQYAVEKYRSLNIPKRLSELSRKELENLYRDLSYIERLKSSTVRGAKEVQRKLEPIKNNLKTLSPEAKKKFWEIYGKQYEITSGTFEKYKYEVWGTILDMMYQGKTEETIIEDIINAEIVTDYPYLGGDGLQGIVNFYRRDYDAKDEDEGTLMTYVSPEKFKELKKKRKLGQDKKFIYIKKRKITF